MSGSHSPVGVRTCCTGSTHSKNIRAKDCMSMDSLIRANEEFMSASLAEVLRIHVLEFPSVKRRYVILEHSSSTTRRCSERDLKEKSLRSSCRPCDQQSYKR